MAKMFLKDMRNGKIWPYSESIAHKPHLVEVSHLEEVRLARKFGYMRKEGKKADHQVADEDSIGFYKKSDIKNMRMFELYSVCKSLGLPYGKGYKRQQLIDSIFATQASPERVVSEEENEE